MEIATGYFGQMKKYISMGYCPTGVVLFPPKWYNGRNLKSYAPSLELFNKCKSGDISGEDFYKEYYEEVKKTGVRRFIEYIKEKEREGVSKIVLLCFEKPEEICHRHILARYLSEELGCSINEMVIN